MCCVIPQVSQWIEEVGESRLKTLGELEDSLEQLHYKQTVFKDFYTAAYVRQLLLHTLHAAPLPLASTAAYYFLNKCLFVMSVRR